MEPVLEKIQAYQRTTWLPETEDRDGELNSSKFSGKPWLSENESWPKCGNCGKEMQLFVQLNLDELPPELGHEYGRGLLQMFYCTSSDPLCEDEGEAYFPFSKSTLLRVIDPTGQKAAANIEIPTRAIPDYFPAKAITGWTQSEDYPNTEELHTLDVELSDDDWDELVDTNYPRGGDKLAGWPAWIQGVEYPNCPVCGETMRLVFQVDSEDHLPYMFGDVGTGHITQCKKHLDQVAFGWACT